MNNPDVVVIGSGPNGLAAGIELQRNGFSVLIVEAKKEIGGGTGTLECTLPGFYHDHCSAVHPMGYLSPFFKSLPLEEHGLNWIFPEASVAHPLDNQPAVILYKSVKKTAEGLGAYDGKVWEELVGPFLKNPSGLLDDVLSPLRFPNNPVQLARFGLKGILPVSVFVQKKFKDERAKALFAGCAAHSILPFDKYFTSAVGLIFALTGHMVEWPISRGGSQAIGIALSSYFKSIGGCIQTSCEVKNLKDLPQAKFYFFDTDPLQLAKIAKDELPKNYLNSLAKYNYGPGVFKIDFALSDPIPWKDNNCLKASTVHVGGSLKEMEQSEAASWNGKYNSKPFVLVCQQSQFDNSRAPDGKHTGYAYCHVPNGSTLNMTTEIESQIERFAPGFRETILARKVISTDQFYQTNRNFHGGAIAGGAADITQLFTRPVLRLNPYSTPNPKIYICSASTPPGGGVHGMCGYHAARTLINLYKK